jgi:hypothetical protein
VSRIEKSVLEKINKYLSSEGWQLHARNI